MGQPILYPGILWARGLFGPVTPGRHGSMWSEGNPPPGYYIRPTLLIRVARDIFYISSDTVGYSKAFDHPVVGTGGNERGQFWRDLNPRSQGSESNKRISQKWLYS